MDILQMAAVGIVAAFCALVVRQRTPDIGAVIAVAACALLLFVMLPIIETIFSLVRQMSEMAQLSEVVIAPVIKTVGIAIVTKFAAEVCRDAKENSIAGFIELAGATAALLLVIPLLNMVLELIGGLL